MQIHVNHNGKIEIFEVKGDITVGELKQLILQRFGRNDDPLTVDLSYQKGGLDKKITSRPDVALHEYDIPRPPNPVIMKVVFKAEQPGQDAQGYDEKVKPRLLELLNTLANASEHRVIFVGLGSCASPERNDDEIRRQQCPKALSDYCFARGWKLTVILVDNDFKTTKNKQIYTIDDKWHLREGENSPVRHYQYFGVKDWHLWVFGTHADGREWQGQSGTLAGLDICSTFEPCVSAYGGCIITGYFYVHANPYCLCGDRETVHDLMQQLNYDGKVPFFRNPERKPEEDLSQLPWHVAIQRSQSSWAQLLESLSTAYNPSQNGTLSVIDVLIGLSITERYNRLFNRSRADFGFWEAFRAFRDDHADYRYSLAPVDVIRMLKNLSPVKLYILHRPDWQTYEEFKSRNREYDYPH
jgi:hypothetical protein